MICLVLVALSVSSLSQAPNAFAYQAILRYADGRSITNETVLLQIKIVNDQGISSYEEIHNIVTNEFGYANVLIGKGATSDDLSSVDWAKGPYFLDISVNGETLGSSQLLSVPYALFAASGNGGPQGPMGMQGIQGNIGGKGS